MASKVLEEEKPPGTGQSSMPIRNRKTGNKYKDGLWTQCLHGRIPLAIANKYHDHQTNQPKSVRYRLILDERLTSNWLRGDRLKDLQAHVTAGHKWIPAQQLPTTKSFYMHMPPTARTGLHTCACRLDCTMHAPGVSWHKLALSKKSHRCRAFSFWWVACTSNIGYPSRPTKHKRGASMWSKRPHTQPC